MTDIDKEVESWVNKLAPEDFHHYFKFRWLYGSNFGNKWWCFDNFCNLLIERLYIERLSSAKKSLKKIKNDIEEKIESLFPNTTNKKDKSEILSPESEGKSEKEIKSFVFDDVYFEDSPNEEDEEDEIDEEQEKNKKYYKMALELLYSDFDDDTVPINGKNYRIDLDKLIQLNAMFPDKKRSIKRLSFENVTPDNLINQMKLNSIKGISGLPFT